MQKEWCSEMFPKHHTFRHIHKVSLENHLQNHRTPDSGSEGWGFESLPVYHSKNAASEKMQRFFFDFLCPAHREKRQFS